MKKFVSWIACFAAISLLVSCQEKQAISIMPCPVSVEETGKVFKLSEKLNFKAAGSEEVQQIAGFLKTDLSQRSGLTFKESEGARSIVLTIDQAVLPQHPEGYQISVTENQVTLKANSCAGLFYATKTLSQLMQIQTFGLGFPTCEIEDYPRFAYRGAMLDVCRHFFDVDDVKRYIDLISDIKLNTLHLHLSDDQGWRIEIKSWPELTNIGGKCQVGEGDGGFYTQEQFAEIVRYAAERQITIVPEIDMPGHTNAVLSSYAELNPDGKKKEPYRDIKVGFSTLDTSNELTYKLIDDVIREISALCPGPYFHIGGDECNKTEKDEYVKFMNRVMQMVHKYGKRVIGWEELANAEVDSESIVQLWRGKENAVIGLAKGAKVLASPAGHCYLDMQYDSTSYIGLHWIGYVEVDKAYNWDPSEFLEVGDDRIVGVESPLWTETVVTFDDIEYLVFPRLVGHAEIGWSPRESRNWEGYQSRLVRYASRMEADGVDFYRSPLVPWK